MDIRPFRIEASSEQLDDLNTRLALTRFPEKETPDDWTQGVPLSYMKELRDYWLNDYDWRAREKKLNEFPQYLTNIDGLDIHFIHAPSKETDARALILTHGWPGSIVEFQKVIGPLTNPTAHGGNASDAFHVVCPSLPGYGFSERPTETGWNVEKIGAAWSELMVGLGYNKYFAQGGDWGSAVTTAIGIHDADHCAGIHLNMVSVGPDKDTMNDLTDKEKTALASMKFYQDWDSGYSKQQSTRPQTLGYSLVDSPIGQAAWIIEKFYAWSDCGDHPENALSRDEMLDNVMLYWLPGTGASSARLYWESFNNRGGGEIAVPMGCSIFPKEIFAPSKRWIERKFTTMMYHNELEKGGHFAAFEQPEVFVDEIRGCFRELR